MLFRESQVPFQDRFDAGRQLASHLEAYAGAAALVLALPRGGVPVAYEIARSLAAPLEIFVVRKLGAPGQEELAMGAIASGGMRVLNQEVIQVLGIAPEQIDSVTARETVELERRERQYRGGREPVNARGRTVILVDDGLATGSTMRAAAAALRQCGPQKIVAAIPVAAQVTCANLRRVVDEVVCLLTPQDFYAVGQFYQDFSPISDVEVRELYRRAAQELSQHPAA